jgi:hypothetical protein
MTSDTEIEEELTSYLKSLAGSPEHIPLAAHHPCNNQTDTSSPPREVNPYLRDILSLEPSLEEIHNTISDLDNSASAWELSPRLIKLTANTTWTVPTRKGKKRLKREARRHQWELAQGITPQTSPIPQTYNKTYTAERALNLLRMIVTLSFQSGDIPPSEKFGRLTGLPKAEGPLNSTDCMRPITVSPIIGRVINNVLAKRLGALLVKHKILDPAQFSFLPGRNIHQAIESILRCLHKSKHSENNSPGRACYAVFYDISKAYDSIKWSSIQNALFKIGAPDDLIDFVMSCLQGTQISMRTNVPGKTTPFIPMHKAIKQGCPLAPLLFIIVMNELHVEYRKIGGYTLDDSCTISSRGYCDDTAILADNMQTLQRLNDCTTSFFNKHGLKLNHTKTYLIGRNADGSPSTTPLRWKDQHTDLLIHPRDHTYAIRYLGLHLNMDLTLME